MQKIVSDEIIDKLPVWLRNFVDGYQLLSTSNLDLLANIYHKNITFIDPMHQVKGIHDLAKYFEGLYQNLLTCDFVINNVIVQANEAAVFWTMSYRHPKLNKGKLVTIMGSSYLKGQQDKVIYHQDYLDLGAMLYEQIPLFGKLTKWVKTKAAS